MAMDDLHKGTYTGQFGFVMVDSGQDPGHYDQEIFLALRDWEPFFTSQLMDDDDEARAVRSPKGPLCSIRVRMASKSMQRCSRLTTKPSVLASRFA